MNDSIPNNNRAFLFALITCIGLAFVTWSGYCFLMAKRPATFDQPTLRAFIRIGCVMLPALLFQLCHARRFQSRTDAKEKDFFGFRRNWIFGVVAGVVVSAVFLGVIVYDPLRGEFKPWPRDISIWLNYILGSPLAEEMLFRCVLATQIVAISQNLDGAKGWDSWISAVILSAAVFAAFHLPAWIAAGELTLPEMIVESAKLFGYGCGFAILYLATRSIWASLIPHWINNLVAQLL